MLDRLKAAQVIHQRALKKLAGEAVTYDHGELSVSLTMVRGQSNFTSTNSDGEAAVESRSIDWLIDPADLVIGGESIEPSIGATITPDAGDGVYELQDLGNGMAWSPGDGRGARIRIHTSRIGDAPK